MAEVKDNKESAKKEKPLKMVESVYTLEDILRSGIFKVPPECVIVAFQEKGITEATEKDAKRIVNEFLKREVK